MLINKLLSSAVKLWLKSQVSAIKSLEINIFGYKKQIFTGYIPKINIFAENAVYREIHFSKLKVIGTNIKFNLSEILKKKPFQLLEPVSIDINVLLTEEDIKNSLVSPLLNSGLTDIWHKFLEERLPDTQQENKDYCWNYFELSEEEIYFKGIDRLSEKNDFIAIKTKIKLLDRHFLQLSPVHIDTKLEFSNTNQPLTLDLGKQVCIDKLEITQDNLLVRGTITIYP